MFSQPDAPDVMLLVFCFSTSIIPKRSHDRIEIDNCIFAKTGGTCMSFLLLLFAVDRCGYEVMSISAGFRFMLICRSQSLTLKP